MKVRFAEPAQWEVAEARSFYSRVSPRQRAGFNAALRQAVMLLARHPLAGQFAGSRFRRQVVSGYPYTLLYLCNDEEVYVYALMHHRRDPVHWAELQETREPASGS